jgi:hypothetical protein
MVLGLLDLLIMAGMGYLGYRFFTHAPPPPRPMPKPVDIGRHLAKGAIRKPLGPGEIIYMQNSSPYNYEPDGNLL